MDKDKPRPDLSLLKIDREKRYDDRPKSKIWRYIAGVIIVILFIVGFYLVRSRVTPALNVKVGTVSLITGSDAVSSLVATGYVVAQRKAEVASKGTGRLKELNYEEGDTVGAGQVIAVLDNEDIKAGLEQARAGLAQAAVDTLNSGRAYRRVQGLFKTGAATDVDLENAEAQYKNSLAALEGAQAAVKSAEVNLENTYIRAPFRGTVLTKNAEVGEIVAPFASSASSKGSVVTLADMSSLEVEADVSESNINRVRPGQRCEITLDAYPSVQYPGMVKKIVPTADRSRATVLTKVSFNRLDDRVLPEMSARVNFFLDSLPTVASKLLAISKDAVTTRDGQKVVFRIDGQTATMVPIQVGRDLGKMVEVTSGLTEGERVVLTPPGKLATGQKVESATK